MGIFCDINLCTPSDGRYIYSPGSIISGAIRYSLDEDYKFSSITVSLKGTGHLYLEDSQKKRNNRRYMFTNDETYVDLNNVIYTNEKGEPYPKGQYDTQFRFQLPYNIPASIDYKKHTLYYYVLSHVKYFICIKFERPGTFKLNKFYNKEITVISGQTPRLTTEHLIYGNQKKLLQLSSLFSSKKGLINLKAVIANSVRSPGESVKVHFEVTNDTNVSTKGLEVKIAEVDQYTTEGGLLAKVHTDVENTAYAYEGIAGGAIGKFTVDILVPEHCASFDHCSFLRRDYSLMILVRLPDPHINLPLEIPFQVVKTLSSRFEENAFLSNNAIPSDPPTYWQAMAEDIKDIPESKEVKGDASGSKNSEELEAKK